MIFPKKNLDFKNTTPHSATVKLNMIIQNNKTQFLESKHFKYCNYPQEK